MLFSQVGIPFDMFICFVFIAGFFIASGGQLWSNYNFRQSHASKDNPGNMAQCRTYIIAAIADIIAFDALGIWLIISEGTQIFDRVFFLIMITAFVGTTSRALWLASKRKKVQAMRLYAVASLIEISIIICEQVLLF